jgi:hypothetical protein
MKGASVGLLAKLREAQQRATAKPSDGYDYKVVPSQRAVDKLRRADSAWEVYQVGPLTYSGKVIGTSYYMRRPRS